MPDSARCGFRPRALAGWGKTPVERCRVAVPFDGDALVEPLRSPEVTSVIPRGLGRSYGDSASNLGQGVILQTQLDRFSAFDEGRGVVECEAGVSFAELASTFVPRGWFVPVTPGTKHVTVGGAIAADVHGKNHHVDGTFGEHVEAIELLLPSGELRRCSPTEEPELFWATVGGMGLTGIITKASFRLHRIESAHVTVEYRRTSDLDETLAAFEETHDGHRYSVAWLDGLASGTALGRSVLMLANDGRVEDLPTRQRSTPLRWPDRSRVRVPFDLPRFALSPGSVSAFNALYYARHTDGRRIVDLDRFFYPLDGIEQWNRIYGRRGFIQYQALFPRSGARRALIALLEAVAESRRASFLTVLKACGPRGRGLLSYLHEGYTLALDFPNTGADLRAFTAQLDALLLRHGGRLYLAKDARMSRETFEAMYPEARQFKAIKERIDPEHRMASSQARRLGLTPT